MASILARRLAEVIVLGVSVLVVWLALVIAPVTYSDWYTFFYPASQVWTDPYSVHGILNPPWTFALLAPLALMPVRVAIAGLNIIVVVAIGLYVRSPYKMLAVVSSAPFMAHLAVGQIDGLVMLGLLAPHGLGIPLILIKPQAALLTVLARLNWASVSVAVGVGVLSVVVWGFWWQDINLHGYNPDPGRNLALFPYTLPLAVGLGWWGYRQGNDALLCAATLCLTPFYQLHSLLPLIACAIREVPVRWGLGLSVASWVVLLVVRG